MKQGRDNKMSQIWARSCCSRKSAWFPYPFQVHAFANDKAEISAHSTTIGSFGEDLLLSPIFKITAHSLVADRKNFGYNEEAGMM